MSQRQEIKKALLAGKKISPLSALRDYGCFRLAARIWEIRTKDGLEVETRYRHQGNKEYAVYYLAEPSL